MSMKVSYDPEADVLYLAREGQLALVEEVYPGINLELDDRGELLGIEILRASELLREVLAPLGQRGNRPGQG